MKIEPATRNDFFTFAEIEKSIFGDDAFGVYILEEYFNRNVLFPKIIDPNTSTIIGFAIVTNEKASSIHDSVMKKVKYDVYRCSHLVNFVLRKEFWGKGIGKNLMSYIIDETEKLGFSYMILEVNVKNKRAIGLYESLGFKIIEKIKKYYSSGLDAYVMLLKYNKSI